MFLHNSDNWGGNGGCFRVQIRVQYFSAQNQPFSHDLTYMGGSRGVLGCKMGHFCVKINLHFQMGGSGGIIIEFYANHHDPTIMGDKHGVFAPFLHQNGHQIANRGRGDPFYGDFWHTL